MSEPSKPSDDLMRIIETHYTSDRLPAFSPPSPSGDPVERALEGLLAATDGITRQSWPAPDERVRLAEARIAARAALESK